jgi:hypothetical protein
MLESKGLVVDEEPAISAEEETLSYVEAIAEKQKKQKKKLKNNIF